MQGLESLNQFKNFMSSLGGLGRFEDTYMVHASEGETVVPMEVLNKSPVLKRRLFKTMRKMGIDPERYIVGNDLNSKNPLTGQPEFFLSGLKGFVRKVMPGESERLLPAAAAFIPGIGPVASAAFGAGIGALVDPDWKRGLGQGAMMGGIGRYGLSKLPSGMGGEMYKLPDQYMGKDWLSSIAESKLNPFRTVEPPIDSSIKDNLETIKSLRNSLEKAIGQNNFEAIESLTTSIKNLEATTVKEATKKGINPYKLMAMFGLGTAALGAAIDEPEDIRIPPGEFEEGSMYAKNLLFPEGFDTSVYTDYASPIVPAAAHGGIMDLQGGGFSQGPGTGTSDSIPAMLSDGEFVMTADAVRGAGGGNRREGARKMYQMMDRLEGAA